MKSNENHPLPPARVRLIKIHHKAWVSLAIPYLPEVFPSIRALPGVQWDASHRIWQFPYSHYAYRAMKDGLLNQVALDCQEANATN